MNLFKISKVSDFKNVEEEKLIKKKDFCLTMEDIFINNIILISNKYNSKYKEKYNFDSVSMMIDYFDTNDCTFNFIELLLCNKFSKPHYFLGINKNKDNKKVEYFEIKTIKT